MAEQTKANRLATSTSIHTDCRVRHSVEILSHWQARHVVSHYPQDGISDTREFKSYVRGPAQIAVHDQRKPGAAEEEQNHRHRESPIDRHCCEDRTQLIG
jgi:hypothetical protein